MLAASREGRLCRDVQRGPVHGLADVALVVLRDEQDFISRLGLGAHEIRQRRHGGVSVGELVDKVAVLVKIEYVMVCLRISAGSTCLRTR
jgi:hypothetical protein